MRKESDQKFGIYVIFFAFACEILVMLMKTIVGIFAGVQAYRIQKKLKEANKLEASIKILDKNIFYKYVPDIEELDSQSGGAAALGHVGAAG